MIDSDIRKKLERLAAGRGHINDLDRVFLDLRDRTYGAKSIREVGDFVAHRRSRDRGISIAASRDISTSYTVWSMGIRGQTPTIDDLLRSAKANLRTATIENLQDLSGLVVVPTKKKIETAIERYERGDYVSESELQIISKLGSGLIWNPAFTQDNLDKELKKVLYKNRIFRGSELNIVDRISNQVSLYVLCIMHGSKLHIEGAGDFLLQAGCANKHGNLEVKFHIEHNYRKPIIAGFCVFFTRLPAREYCSAALVELSGGWDSRAWKDPIEVLSDGTLDAIL